MPCQLMVGFFAYAKSREINVDHEELEGTYKIYSSSLFGLLTLLFLLYKLFFFPP